MKFCTHPIEFVGGQGFPLSERSSCFFFFWFFFRVEIFIIISIISFARAVYWSTGSYRTLDSALSSLLFTASQGQGFNNHVISLLIGIAVENSAVGCREKEGRGGGG